MHARQRPLGLAVGLVAAALLLPALSHHGRPAPAHRPLAVAAIAHR